MAAVTRQPIKTAKNLENLKPEGKKYRCRVTNGEHGGLSVMVLPSGTRQFIYRYRRPSDGKQAEITLPTQQLAKAREHHIQCREWVRMGKDPAHELHKEKRENAEALTMQQVFDDWIKDYEKTASRKTKRIPTAKAVSQHKRRWRIYLGTDIGALHAREVERWQLVRVLDKAKARSVEEARQCLTILREMLGHAEEVGYIDKNPATTISATRRGLVASEPRKRALNLVEMREVWKSLNSGNPVMTSAIKLLIVTGCRRDEVASMRWDEVDMTTGLFTIPASRTKNRQPHLVHLPQIALDILETIKPLTEQSGFVFESPRKPKSPIHPDSITKALERLRGVTRPKRGKVLIDKKAPLAAVEAFTVHDLRRSATTAWGKHCKILPHVAEAMLNHLPTKLARTYNKADYWNEKRAGWEAWGTLIGTAISRDRATIYPLFPEHENHCPYHWFN